MTRGRPKALTAQVCKGCGIEFQPDSSRQEFHSLDCYHTWQQGRKRGAYKEHETRICPVCGTSFPVGGVEGKKKTTVYCSTSCGQFGRERATEISPISDTEAAYIAGFTDGEGCITLSRRRGTLEPRIVVANTKRAVLDWMTQATGVGSVNTKSAGSNPVSEWHITGSGAISLLRRIRPFLRVKAQQADIVTQAFERYRGSHSSRQDTAWQDGIIAEIRELNKRIPI